MFFFSLEAKTRVIFFIQNQENVLPNCYHNIAFKFYILLMVTHMIHVPLVKQESNLMLLYSMLICHKCLKMNMKDGLVEGLCMVLNSLRTCSWAKHVPSTNQIIENTYDRIILCGCRKDFTEFADVCFREYGDRVSHWTTLNEGNVFALAGYDSGILPPQRCSPPFGHRPCTKGNSSFEPYIAGHHLLLAHASAARLYKKKYQVPLPKHITPERTYTRKETAKKMVTVITVSGVMLQAKQHGFIGINVFAYWFAPLTNTTEDITATQRAKDFYLGW